MILQLRRWLPDRYLGVVADSTYAALEWLAGAAGIRQPVTVITRLRLDAAFYDPAPERKAGTKGRPRLKGARQPTLEKRLIDPETNWQKLMVSWYGGVMREVEVATATALWYHTGMAPVAIRWILIGDPEGKFDPQALLCTDHNVEPAQIMAWFVLRWQVEVTFHEVRAHLGVETRAAVVGPGYFENDPCPFRDLFARGHLCPSIAG